MKLLGKTVNYFGIQLVVSQDTKYLVTNSEGHVIASEQKPEFDYKNGWCYDWDEWITKITRVDLEGMDWKDTLMEVE